MEVGYGVLPEQEGNGYASEALMAMAQWAFRQPNVVFVEAETDPENKASQRVLGKCGFTPDGMGKEGLRFVLESPLTNWLAVYMCFGISIGMALGRWQDQMLLGMAIGISLGVLVGWLLDDTAFAGDHVRNDSISYCNAAADRACIPVCDAEQSGLQKEMVSGRQAGNGCI